MAAEKACIGGKLSFGRHFKIETLCVTAVLRNFREIKCISRDIFFAVVFHSVKVDLLSHFLDKNFVKVMFLLKKRIDLTKVFYGDDSKFFIFPLCICAWFIKHR